MLTKTYHWLVASSLGAAALAFIILTADVVLPDDPDLLVRYLLVRFAAAITGFIALSGGMLFIDFITPDDWMAKIGKNEIASALVMSAVVLVLGAILCWS